MIATGPCSRTNRTWWERLSSSLFRIVEADDDADASEPQGCEEGRDAAGCARVPFIAPREFGLIRIGTEPGAPRVEDESGQPLRVQDFSQHLLVTGETGSGKTYRVLQQILREFFRSHHLPPGPRREAAKFGAFFMDPKGDIGPKAYRLAKAFGRASDFIFMGPKHLDQWYDPFGDPEELPLQRASKMMELVKAYNPGKSGDPFWDMAAMKLFLNVFLLLEALERGQGAGVAIEAPRCSFPLLHTLIMDKAVPRNAAEIQAALSRQQRAVEALLAAAERFRTGTLRTVQSIRRFETHAMETADREIGSQLERLEKEIEGELGVEGEGQVPSEKWRTDYSEATHRAVESALLRGCLAGIESREPGLSCVPEGDLAEQMDALAQAAQAFIAEPLLEAKLEAERILLGGRPIAAEILDVVPRIGRDGAAAAIVDALTEWASAYRELLAVHEQLAKVEVPAEEAGPLRRLLTDYEKLLEAEGRDPSRDELWSYFTGEHLHVANERTSGSVSMVCSNTTNLFVCEPMASMFGPGGSWDWKRAIDEGKLVALDMPAPLYGAAAKLASILLKTDFFRVSLARKTARMGTGPDARPLNQERFMLFMVDEFQVMATEGEETGEAAFLERVREFNVACVFGTQNLQVLRKKMAHEQVEALVGNLVMQWFLRNSDAFTCEMAEKRFAENLQVTGNINQSAAEMALNRRDPGSEGFSFGVQYASRFRASAFRALGTGECIMRLPARFGTRQALQTVLAGESLAAFGGNSAVAVPTVLVSPWRTKTRGGAVGQGAGRGGAEVAAERGDGACAGGDCGEGGLDGSDIVSPRGHHGFVATARERVRVGTGTEEEGGQELREGALDDRLGAMDEIGELRLFIGGGTAVFCGVIVAAAAAKWWEYRAARKWLAIPGRVTRSEVGSRRRRGSSKGQFVVENVPRIEYDYTVGGRRFVGTRVSLGEVAGNVDVEETLATYPVGREVTVYYDAKNPGDAVLDREWPAFVTQGLIWVLALFGGGGLFVMAWVTSLPDWVAPHLARPERAPLVTLVGGMALFTGWVGEAIRREGAKTMRWLPVEGKVVVSRVNCRTRRRLQPMYSAEIVCEYEVNGQRYRSSQGAVGGGFFESNLESWAAGAVAAHPLGKSVTVYANPENPSESVRERGGSVWKWMWGGSLGLAALSYWLGT